IGRLRDGAQPSQVSAQLTTELRRYLLDPANAGPHYDLTKIDAQVIRLAPGGGGINAMKEDYEQGLLLLMAVAISVLFIACANLANLLLARSTVHRVRTAVELAMGASRARIVRRHVTESVVLALLGGLAGLVVAVYASKALVLIAFRGATYVPIATGPSVPILLFTFGISLLTGLVFGVGPAWMASHSDPADALRGSGRVMRDSSALPQRALVVLQAAVSLALLTVAGLLTQSLGHFQNAPYGFAREGRLVVRIDPQSAGYTSDRLTGLYEKLEDRLKHTPGVLSESLSLYTAQQGNNWGEGVYIQGTDRKGGSSWDRVSAHYFETLGTPIVRGRGFSEQDTTNSRKVAVVNEAFARRYFPNENPLGRHFGKDELSHAGDYEIVGVAKDAIYHDPSRPVQPMFFVPLAQRVTYDTPVDNRVEDGSMYMGTIVLHVQGAADAMAPTIRRVLAQVDPNLTPLSMFSFDDLVQIQTSAQTLIARISTGFGVIALLLAVVGLYGVTSYRVARRTGEIGLRMALGADRGDIRALVLRGAFLHVALGLVLGVPLAFLAARAMQSQLYGISPFDPATLLAAAIVLSLCALVASLLPARRAAAIEPMRALRIE
ncbi:MAG: FtsX-like permease family protein, partial [Acidobacteriota bacterium]|nr:FtsX-like permease family protein [Acidobacteriota bacterium]